MYLVIKEETERARINVEMVSMNRVYEENPNEKKAGMSK